MAVDNNDAKEVEIMDRIQNIGVYQWTWYHTSTIICLRLCGELMICTTRIFDDELSDKSVSSLSTYSYINIFRLLGPVCSIFLGPINTKYFNGNTTKIIVMYSMLSGIWIISFGLIYYAKSRYPYTMIIFQSTLWLLHGMCFAIVSAGTIAVSTKYSHPSKHGKIISLINLSWPLSSLFYVIVAYLIDIHPSLPFLTFGAILIIFSVVIQQTYNFKNICSQNMNDSNDSNDSIVMQQICALFKNEFYTILMLISFFIGISTGANITLLGSPILHDLYDLNISSVGWCTLVIFAGELSSILCMTKYSDKLGYFMTAYIAFILKIISGCFILFISFHYDSNSLGSLLLTLFMIFLVYFAWELFFITQLYALSEAVQFNREKNINVHVPKQIVLTAHRASCTVAQAIGTWMAAFIWNEGNGLMYVGLLLMCSTLLGALLYYLYWIKQKKIVKYRLVIDSSSADNSEVDIHMRNNSD